MRAALKTIEITMLAITYAITIFISPISAVFFSGGPGRSAPVSVNKITHAVMLAKLEFCTSGISKTNTHGTYIDKAVLKMRKCR